MLRQLLTGRHGQGFVELVLLLSLVALMGLAVFSVMFTGHGTFR